MLGLAAFSLHSCSDDFEVAAPYKNVTLVYGLLNMEDTAHYIKIQKAFLDEKKGALEMAKEPDSSYYTNLNVVIKELRGSGGVDTITLQRVDVNQEGYPKDTGTFFTKPNYAYKFKHALNPDNQYRLLITNPADGTTDSATIDVLDAAQLVAPNINAKYQFNFAKTVPVGSSKIDIFCQVPEKARYIEGKIKFRWVEKNLSNGTETDREADFLFAGESVTADYKNISNSNISFYTFLKGSMGLPSTSIERYMDSCQLFLAVGAKEVYDYIVVTNIQSSGLTADQLKPLYTNLLGDDVYGIFSSRAYKSYDNIPISDATLDSLRINPVTADLNIRGRSNK